MASANGTAIRTLASPPTLADRRLTSRQPATISVNSFQPPRKVSSPVRHCQDGESMKSLFNGHKSMRNIVAMTTGETTAEVATEPPEIVTIVQETWERLDDKYAVASLAIATLIALYGSIGLISAIDRLPLVPSLLELIGIAYTGWFVYRYLLFKPDKETLFAKVKNIYSDVIGSN